MEQLTLFTEEYGYSPDPGHAPDMPFAQLAELYFTHYAEQNLKASTKANYRYMADRFLLPAFGALPLSAFNNLMLTRWFAELPVSPAYCKNIFTVLRSMFTEIEKLLRRQKREQELWMVHCGCDDSDTAKPGSPEFPHPEIVFTTPKGNFIDHNYTERKFKQFVAGTSFSNITLHSLRHANATLMLAAGVDLKVVSALLGHSSIATTANLYTEVLDSTKAEAAMKISMQLGQTEEIP